MREILFRGKRIDDGEWVEGDLIQLHDGRRYIVNNVHGACIDDKGNFINTEEPFVCAVNPDTVGQYTGLKDKNGKKIFEGDIVTGLFLFEMQVKAVVGFRDGSFGLEWMRGKVPELTAFASTCNITWEVIGNIHDNPELVEVAEDDEP